MNGRISIVNDGNFCTVCNRLYTHRRVISPSSIHGLCNIELVTSCPKCRNLFRRRKALEDKMHEIDWLVFGLQHTNYFDV